MFPTMFPDYKKLPLYRSHKFVRAARIGAVSRTKHGGALVLDLSKSHEPPETRILAIKRSESWMDKHNPEEGGYYVVYEDGYSSYSPAEPFEKGYTLLDDDAEGFNTQEPRPSMLDDLLDREFNEAMNDDDLHEVMSRLGIAGMAMFGTDEDGNIKHVKSWHAADTETTDAESTHIHVDPTAEVEDVTQKVWDIVNKAGYGTEFIRTGNPETLMDTARDFTKWGAEPVVVLVSRGGQTEGMLFEIEKNERLVIDSDGNVSFEKDAEETEDARATEDPSVSQTQISEIVVRLSKLETRMNLALTDPLYKTKHRIEDIEEWRKKVDAWFESFTRQGGFPTGEIHRRLDDMAQRLAALEKWAHEPFDFSDLEKRLDALELHAGISAGPSKGEKR